MLGNEIVLTAEPNGVFKEGIVSGTPKPGTVMQVQATTEPEGGRFTWEVFDADADGDQRLIAVLLPDHLQGKLATDAYTDGERCFLYCPQAGDELNMLVKDVDTGTSDSFAIGDLLMVEDGSGLLIDTTGDPQSESFICMETYQDLTTAQANFLVHCMFTGF